MIVAHHLGRLGALRAAAQGVLFRNSQGAALFNNRTKKRLEVVPQHLTDQLVQADPPLLEVPASARDQRKKPLTLTDAGVRALLNEGAQSYARSA